MRSFSLQRQVRSDVQHDPQSHGTVVEHIINHVQANDMASFVYANVSASRAGYDTGNMMPKVEPPSIRTAAIRQQLDRNNASIDARRPDRQDMGAGVRRILRESATPNARQKPERPPPIPRASTTAP